MSQQAGEIRGVWRRKERGPVACPATGSAALWGEAHRPTGSDAAPGEADRPGSAGYGWHMRSNGWPSEATVAPSAGLNGGAPGPRKTASAAGGRLEAIDKSW